MAFTTLDSGSSLSPADADDVVRTARLARIGGIAGAVLLALWVTGGVLLGLYAKRMVEQVAPLLGPNADAVDPASVSIIVIALHVIVAGLFVMPVVFLFQYAQRMLAAVRGGFQASAFSDGLRVQRNLFTYALVLVIVMLALSLIWTAMLTIVMLAPPPALPMQYGM